MAGWKLQRGWADAGGVADVDGVVSLAVSSLGLWLWC